MERRRKTPCLPSAAPLTSLRLQAERWRPVYRVKVGVPSRPGAVGSTVSGTPAMPELVASLPLPFLEIPVGAGILSPPAPRHGLQAPGGIYLLSFRSGPWPVTDDQAGRSPSPLRILFEFLSAGKSSKDQKETRRHDGKSISQMSKVRFTDILGWACAVHNSYSL